MSIIVFNHDDHLVNFYALLTDSQGWLMCFKIFCVGWFVVVLLGCSCVRFIFTLYMLYPMSTKVVVELTLSHHQTYQRNQKKSNYESGDHAVDDDDVILCASSQKGLFYEVSKT